MTDNGSNRQDDWRERQGIFFASVFGPQEGYLCLAKIHGKTGNYTEKFFQYPDNLDDALDWADKYLPTCNLYFCAQLLEKPQRRKEHINKVAQVWADLDPCHPDKLLVPPSIAWESSPKRYQAIWRLEPPPIDGQEAEELSHRIALAHKDDGVDQSGWDLTQLLRIPGTRNFKYEPHPTVAILDARPGHYRPDDFAGYPPAPEVGSDGP
jgi:RepB DNA-primase from phage plasmid